MILDAYAAFLTALSVPFYALYGFGVRTVSDLLKLSGKEKIPRIGKVGWEEIKTMQKICADAIQK